jgi:hypothetical protein
VAIFKRKTAIAKDVVYISYYNIIEGTSDRC